MTTTICKQSNTSYSQCSCTSVYYTPLSVNDYTPILTLSTSPYNDKIIPQSAVNVLPITQNKKIGYMRCSAFINDPTLSYSAFVTKYGANNTDGDTVADNSQSLAVMHIRCIEDVWESPFGSPFSTASQNFVKTFINTTTLLGGTTYDVMWKMVVTAMTQQWIYGLAAGAALTPTILRGIPSDRRSLLWFWVTPNTPGLPVPTEAVLSEHTLTNLKFAGYPYTVYQYDSLEYSSYCPSYSYAAFLATGVPGRSSHYYQLASGTDPVIPITADPSWWIRYDPEGSAGSLYIKWPIFTPGTGGTTEHLLKTNFLPFYSAMVLTPSGTATFNKPTWIMRIGLEYLLRGGDDTFSAYPGYMQTTLSSVYSQYRDIKARLMYLTLQQILLARTTFLTGGSSVVYPTALPNSETPSSVIYLAQYTGPTSGTTAPSSVGDVAFPLRNNVPYLLDGTDTNTLFSISTYPTLLLTGEFTIINTAFTGLELGVAYSSLSRSPTTLVFTEPTIDSNVFGGVSLYTTGNGYATDTQPPVTLLTLDELFGSNGVGKSYPRPTPTVVAPPNPFPPHDPEVVNVTATNNTVNPIDNFINYLSTYVLLYILLGVIAIILIIGLIIYFVKPNPTEPQLPTYNGLVYYVPAK
jgi:hypothetical protein